MSKSEVFQVRLTPAEMSVLSQQARMLGMTKTALARTLLVAGQPQKSHPASTTPCPQIAELQSRIEQQEQAILKLADSVLELRRRPFFAEWRARRVAELGAIPGNSQLEKLLYIARDYHSVWGAWPQPNDPGFGSLPSGVDAAAWPKNPPPPSAA